MKSDTQPKFAVCIRNEGSDDLERRKIYQIIADDEAAAKGFLRVIDESGEDYLYPANYFIVVDLPEAVEQALLIAS